MDYCYLVIYQKNNNELIYRTRKTKPLCCKGQTTSMGWKVVDIKRLYNGKCYSLFEYNSLVKNKLKLLSFFNYFQRIDLIKLIDFLIIIYFFIFLCKM